MIPVIQRTMRFLALPIIGIFIAFSGSIVFSTPTEAMVDHAKTKENCTSRGGSWTDIPYQAGVVGNGNCTIGGGLISIIPDTGNAARALTVNDQVLSLLYYRTLGACLTQTTLGIGNGGTINTSGSKSDWWPGGQNTDTPLGPYVKGLGGLKDNWRIDCSETGKLNAAARGIWRIQYDNWLCAAGALRLEVMEDPGVSNNAFTAARRCTDEAGGVGAIFSFYQKDAYGAYNSSSNTIGTLAGGVPDETLGVIRDRVYGGAEPEFTPAMLYQFYRQVFFNTCASGINWETGGTTSKPSVVLEGEFSLMIVPSDGSERVEKWFTFSKNHDKNTSILTRAGGWPNFSDVHRTCGEMISYINNTSNLNAYEKYLKDWSDATGTTPLDSGSGCTSSTADCTLEEVPTCSIEVIGWIICPVIGFTASIADGAFTFLSDSFLRTDPAAFDTDSATFKTWVVMRNIANVAFVIVFLIIIFSQLTGAGLNNYGVKKMLPRLVVAAILVNISFFVTQLAIDLSNILGYSIKDVFTAIGGAAGQTGNSGQSAIDGVLGSASSGGGFAGIAGSIIAVAAGGVIVYAMLSTLIPILLAAVVALIMILFILVARQALIVMLVIVSPLAFVAFLLPNTEGLFKQWRKMLTAMLLLFPIIALVFGASELASKVLFEAFSGGGTVAGGDSNVFGQLIAAAVLVLPLFVVPVLLKKSLDGIPALGQFASRLSNRANGNVGNKLKESYKGSAFGRGRAIRQKAREDFRTQKWAKRMQGKGAGSVIGRVAAGGLAGAIGRTDSQKAQRDAIANTASRIAAGQEAEEQKSAIDAIAREMAEVKATPGGNSDDYLEKMAMGIGRDGKPVTQAMRSAAMNVAASTGRDGVLRKLQKSPSFSGTDSASRDNAAALQRAIGSNAGSLAGKAPDLVKGKEAAFKSFTGADMSKWSEGTAKEYMDHVKSLHDSGEFGKAKAALDAFNTASNDIIASPDLQGAMSADVGISIRDAIAAAGNTPADAAFHTYVNNNMVGAAAIQNDGKIR